jgi:hypothetical protein
MYLYFDKKGILREIINDNAIRQYSDNANVVLMYFETENIPSLITLGITQNSPTRTTLTREIDPSVDFVNITLEYSSERTLSYFKYGKPYKFYKYALTSEDLMYSGLLTIDPLVNFVSENESDAYGRICLVVEKSNVVPTELITQGEYLDLFQEIAKFNQNRINDINALREEAVLIDTDQDITSTKTFKQTSGLVERTNDVSKSGLDIKVYQQNVLTSSAVLDSSSLTFDIYQLSEEHTLLNRMYLNGAMIRFRDNQNNDTSYEAGKLINRVNGTSYEVALPSKNGTLATLEEIADQGDIEALESRVSALETKYLYRHSLNISLQGLVNVWVDIYTRNSDRLDNTNAFYQQLMTYGSVPCYENTFRIVNKNTIRSITRLRAIQGDSLHVKVSYFDITYAIVDGALQLTHTAGEEDMQILTFYNEIITRIY